MIVKTINAYDFRSEFAHMGRQKDFTYAGLNALYEYINETYTGILDKSQPYELDVIALCVQFTEYENLDECLQEVGNDDIKTLEDLYDHTIVIEIEGSEGIIISEF
jgi:hypothetical protein